MLLLKIKQAAPFFLSSRIPNSCTQIAFRISLQSDMTSLNTLETMNCNEKESHNPKHESTNINEEKQSYSAPKLSQSNGDVNETVLASDDKYAIDANPISYSTPAMQRGPKRRKLKKSIVIGTSSIKISISEPERSEIEAMDAQWCTEGGEYLPMSKLLDGWTEEKRRRVDTGTIDKFYNHNYSSKTFRSMVEVKSYIKHHSDPHKKNYITLGESQERNQNNNRPLRDEKDVTSKINNILSNWDKEWADFPDMVENNNMPLPIEEDKKITEEMIHDYLLIGTKSTMEFINMGEENKRGENSEKKASAESDA